jgi:hypothetical protein
MSVVSIEKALIKHLNLLTPTLPTAYEGAAFTPPGSVYQRVQYIPSLPDDPVLGTGYYREKGEFQVFINAPTNKGKGEALTRAELVRQHYKKGTVLTQDGVLIHILSTPHVSSTAVFGDRIIVPVIIDCTSEVLCN